MNRFIVTKNINAPTVAIQKYASMNGWELVVVGDQKTPNDYEVDGTYLSPKDQNKLGFNVSRIIPWNCIQRRNLGFLYAIREGADIIATVDDDNIPLENWGQKTKYIGDNTYVPMVLNGDLVVDPLYNTIHDSSVKLWHRGYPIQLLEQRKEQTLSMSSLVDSAVVSGLWNGEPDIDAIARISSGPQELYPTMVCTAFAVGGRVFSPYNTQNTIFTREVAPCMALPPFVGRMDDIWASYLTERVMFELGKTVVYTEPTVFQRRNEHDATVDMMNELLGYRLSLKLLNELNRVKVESGSVLDMYRQVSDVLVYNLKLEQGRELKEFFSAWIEDVKTCI